jgi:hypothetical protein
LASLSRVAFKSVYATRSLLLFFEHLSAVKKMALAADGFILAPGVRMSILAMGSPMGPYLLTQTDQGTSKSHLQTGRAIGFEAPSPVQVISSGRALL